MLRGLVARADGEPSNTRTNSKPVCIARAPDLPARYPPITSQYATQRMSMNPPDVTTESRESPGTVLAMNFALQSSSRYTRPHGTGQRQSGSLAAVHRVGCRRAGSMSHTV